MAGPRANTTRPRPRRWVVVWTTVALVVSLSAAVLPHLEVPGSSVVPIAQALVPVGAVALLVLALVSLLFRVWVAAGVFVVGAVLGGAPALTPMRGGEACEAAAPVTVMSFNAEFSEADPGVVADLVRSSGSSVVVLVETDETLIDALLREHGLVDILPFRTREVAPGPASGSVILSAYPLSLEEDIPGSEFDQVSAVAAIPDAGDVRLAAVHPLPPVHQPNGWLRGNRDIATWLREAPDDRLIIAGDFNASFAHPVLRHLASGLRSAAEAAGPIPGSTWPEEMPIPAFTAIDHVFARGAAPTAWDGVAIPGSDHRAVIAGWDLCAAER